MAKGHCLSDFVVHLISASSSLVFEEQERYCKTSSCLKCASLSEKLQDFKELERSTLG